MNFTVIITETFTRNLDFLPSTDNLVLAADGSGINIPTTKETLEEFGTSSRKGTKPQASIGLGCLYDVMNRMNLESDCCKCKFDEMRLAEEQAALSAPDTWVDIHLDKSRTRHDKGTEIGRRMEELGHIPLRMVKVSLPGEREEVPIQICQLKPLTAGREQNCTI